MYEAAGKLMAKLAEYPGFATVSSDFFNNTPNLDIELRRDQAKMYGVSETRILSLLRTAYSQNYVYLIKKPQDQYQVILEIADSARAHPEDLSRLYIRSDDGKNLVPLKALVTWKTSLGPAGGEPHQPVHERDAVLQPQARRGDRRRRPTTSRRRPPPSCRPRSARSSRARPSPSGTRSGT